jgi:lipopolysaccharide/colanic/teichoic acid biosynthesis glycosyltransferase
LAKASVDFLLAVLLALPVAAAVALVAIAVKLTSRGPVIYTQTRLGKHGRPFRIYKIRTMYVDSEVAGPRWATVRDPRVTPIGGFLRRSHIDELPQLMNILRGEMSVVGPRPERPEFVVQLEKALPRYRERLAVRPGVTGLAQVQLPPDTDLESVRRKLACDLCYIDRMSLWLDLRIIACTAFGLLALPYTASRRLLKVPSLFDGNDVVAQVEPV